MTTGTTRRLCALAALPDGRATVIDEPGARLEETILLVRRGAHVAGFVNQCPHMGFALDWKAERIALDGGAFVRCIHHNAVFRVADGVCVSGPCPGERLTAVALEIDAGEVVLVGQGCGGQNRSIG